MHRFRGFFLILSICLPLLFGFNAANGQNLPPKYATLELFTNTPCPICGSQNPGMFSRLVAYEGKYHLISFYPGVPYASCIFYQANMPENLIRKTYYSQVFGTPTVVINGTQFKSSSGVTNAVMDAVTGGTTWLEIHVAESTGSTRNVDITLQDHVGGSISTGKLFAVIVEREIMYTAPNGETMHHNVFRKFLTNVNGEDVDMSSGVTTKSYSYTLDPTWEAKQIYVIAWLINPDTKEIYNSGTRFDESLSVLSDINKNSMVLEAYPNPAKNQVFIKLPNLMDEKVNVKIFSPSGQLKKNLKEQLVTSLPLNIPINDLSSGLYFIVVDGKDRSYVARVVVE